MASSSRVHTPVIPPSALPDVTRRLSYGSTVATATGAPTTTTTATTPGLGLQRPHSRSPSRSRSASDSESSTGTEQDEAERTKEEQEVLSKKLKDLSKLMQSGEIGLGFAQRAAPGPSNLRAEPAHARPRRRDTMGLATTPGETHSPRPVVRISSTRDDAQGPPLNTPASATVPPRLPRFARDALPSIPSSSGSSSPGERPPVSTNQYRPPQSLGRTLSGIQSQSESSQGSEASSFSDLTGQSLVF